MNYRHGYHAGNFADVVKHVALIGILDYLKRKDAALSVIDTHAGRGRYDLTGEQATRTGEAGNGIAALTGAEAPPLLAQYLALAAGDHYPGSPLIAAQLLRPQDRLVAIEKHPEEFAILKEVLAPFRNAAAENADGYARLLKLLPPPSRRGLIVIDPPFEAADEFTVLAQTVIAAYRKFATGVYLIWYPVKSSGAANGFLGEVLASGVAKALTITIKVPAPEGKLDQAGLMVINPPFGLDQEMESLRPILTERMKASLAVAWLAGS